MHIDDPNYYDQIYNVTSRLDKDPWHTRSMDLHQAGIQTISHHLHHRRRQVINHLFSPTSMARLEPKLHQIVKKFCSIVQRHKDNDLPLDLSSLYRCFTVDVITEYCFPDCYGMMDTPDYSRDFWTTIRKFSQLSVWNRHIPLILRINQLMPPRLVALINPQIPPVVKFQEVRLLSGAMSL